MFIKPYQDKLEVLEQQNAELLAALSILMYVTRQSEQVKIDFSNGVEHNGIDEGDVKGSNMLHKMLEATKQAIAKAEGGE